MQDIRSVLSKFNKNKEEKNLEKSAVRPSTKALASEIPDLFFDEVLHHLKLSRSEILVLLYLYRQIWCRPNLFKAHGIGPLNSYTDLAHQLGMSADEVVTHLRSLESYGLIETVRSGQYFVRRYFTEENDAKYGQDYDQFL
jgi:DNA-binding MarR family transcriptional regulator